MNSSEALEEAIRLLREAIEHDDAVARDDNWYAMPSSLRDSIAEFLENNGGL